MTRLGRLGRQHHWGRLGIHGDWAPSITGNGWERLGDDWERLGTTGDDWTLGSLVGDDWGQLGPWHPWERLGTTGDDWGSIGVTFPGDDFGTPKIIFRESLGDRFW